MNKLEKPCRLSAATPNLRYPMRQVAGQRKLETRLVLEKKLGRPILVGMVARHLCFQKRCIEPSHLVEATYSENALDADVTRTGTAETYLCGHPRTPENGCWHKSDQRNGGGSWGCLTCNRARARKYMRHRTLRRQAARLNAEVEAV